MKRLVIGGVFLGIAACGADGAGDDDAVDGPDATVSSDGGFECDVGVVFNPTNPAVGDTIVATSSLPESTGFNDYTWTVQRGTTDVPFELAAEDGSNIMFTATAGGAHFVTLDVSGTPCDGFDGAVNVRVPGATDNPWRLRFTAPSSMGAPPQERVVLVPSAADFDYGTVALDPGAYRNGTLVDGDGAAIPGYLQLRPAASPELVLDAFAGTSGSFTVLTTLTPHDVVIYPLVAGLAPRGLADWTPVSGSITVDAGTLVTGTVLDPSGDPVEGATVTIRVDGVPSTAGVTNSAGGFGVRARPAAAALVTVDVVPPDGSGLPRLRSSPAVLDLAMAVAIAYQPSLASRDVAGASVTLGGAPAASAKVTFVGAIATAGVVATGLTQAGAAGTFAIDATTNGAGVLGAMQVPAIATEAVVHAGTSWGEVDVDLTTASPAAITAPGAGTITGRAVDPAQAAVGTAVLRVTPTGALAAAGALERSVTVGTDGTFSTALPGGGDFELVLVDRSADLALRRQTISVAGNANLGDLTLPEGLSLSGKISLSGASAPGVAVTMFCDDCDEADQRRAAAEAASDPGGRYRATVLDPGVQ